MEVGHIPSQLWRLRLWVLLGVAVAAVGASATAYRIAPGIPPSFEDRSLSRGVASTGLIVDAPESVLGSTHIELFPLMHRAVIYARLISSEAVKADVSRQLGIPRASLSGSGPPPPGAEVGREVTAEVRAQELVNEAREYRMLAFRGGRAALVDIFTQAPTREQAIKLANAAASALRRQVETLQRRDKGRRIRLNQISPAQALVVNESTNKLLAGVVFPGLFLLWCLGVLLVSGLAARLRRERDFTRYEP